MADDITQILPRWQEQPMQINSDDPQVVPPNVGAYDYSAWLDAESGSPGDTPPPPSGAPAGSAASTIPNVIIVFNGTAYYVTIGGVITGPV